MHLLVLLTLVVALFACPSVSAAAEPAIANAAQPVPRIRPADNRVAFALREGLERSASFRALVDRVNRHDVIAYVETQPMLRHRLSGAMTWVVATKGFRYVRVSLNPDLSPSQIIAALAHELQHVLEVADEPSIVDNRSLSDYYRAAGLENRTNLEAWETEAAQRTGEVVRREVAESYNSEVDSMRARR